MERGFQPLRKQSLLRWQRIRVGVRDVESGIVGEILRKPSCLKEHTVATGMI